MVTLLINFFNQDEKILAQNNVLLFNTSQQHSIEQVIRDHGFCKAVEFWELQNDKHNKSRISKSVEGTYLKFG